MTEFTPGTLPSDLDYATFVDRNVHKYLPKFKRYSANPVSFQAGWHWPAFFVSFWWFLYRKMYLWAVLAFLSFLIPYFNLFICIGWGMAANHLYFKHTNAKIAELKTYHGEEYGLYLRDTGGVNSWVPWVALLVTGGFFCLMLLAGLVGVAFLAAWS